MKAINFLLSVLIGGADNENLIKQQISRIKDRGFDGVVFKATDGAFAGNSDFSAFLNGLILYAKSLSLSVWLAPKECGNAAVAIGNKRLMLRGGEVELVSDPNVPSPFYEICAYERVLGVFEELKSVLDAEAFEYITGFSVELGGFECPENAVPWYDEIEEEFLNDYGMDIKPFLKELFVRSGGSSKLRARYMHHISERYAKSSLAPLGEWCAEHGKSLIMRSDLAAPEADFIRSRGSYLETEKAVSVPSVTVGSPDEISIFHASAAAGLARQYGSGEAAAEVFGGSGWGLDPSSFEECLRTLIECGISTFIIDSCCPCLDYSALSRRKILFPDYMPWSMALPDIFASLKSFADIEQKRLRRILLVCPTRAIRGEYIPGNENTEAEKLFENADGICGRLYEMSRRFDITDEELLESDAEFGESGITIGGASYSTLLTAPGCAFGKKGRLTIEKAKANGVRILSDIPKSDTEIIPLELIRNTMKEIVPIAVNQDNWTITPPKKNILPLKPFYSDGRAEFRFAAGDGYNSETVLLLSDAAATVSINDIIVQKTNEDERGFYYNLTGNILSGSNKITADACANTFAYLIGDFKIFPKTGYRAFDERQIQTRGGFVLNNSGIESETNLVRCGYPFASDCASAKKIIYIEENKTHPILKMDCSGSSIIEVCFDNEFVGFMYGSRNKIELPSMAADERHVVEIRCYPSGFNLYGDKYYIFGDTGKSVCPETSGYIKDENIKLVNWKIPRDIELIQEF